MPKLSKQDRVETLFKSIEIGKDKAFIPPKSIAKEFSSYIDERNLKGDVVINLGEGYYRPNPLSSEEHSEFNQYLAQEYERANSIIDRCIKMQFVYNYILDHIMKTWEDNNNV